MCEASDPVEGRDENLTDIRTRDAFSLLMRDFRRCTCDANHIVKSLLQSLSSESSKSERILRIPYYQFIKSLLAVTDEQTPEHLFMHAMLPHRQQANPRIDLLAAQQPRSSRYHTKPDGEEKPTRD
jgi:hypothetical protein